jgi:peptidoglycan-N-acetylglucosamine deacetylase
MERSPDDDGNSSTTTALLSKAAFLCLFILPFAVYKSPAKEEGLTKPVARQSEAKALPEVLSSSSMTGKKKKRLYVTFDDGPNKGTHNILRIVEDEGVPVSFFVVGQHVFGSRTQSQLWDSLKATKQIELCNHSYSHAKRRYESYYARPDSVVADFARTQDSLDLENTICRTPGRNIWRIDSLQVTDLKKSAAAADSLRNAGFQLMGWDLEWRFDHKTNCVVTGEKMVEQIDSVFKHNCTRHKNNLVLLAHDQDYANSADSMELRRFFQLLKQKEYELSLVREYPGIKKRDTVNLQ